ncbi:unnamed protein product [Brachionus calyciflorus]|uniref:Uncharacterized protein n=1 Tax=Brachionus calyciflorus TaxID=104777 RepID=A0A813WVI4_9BILA|nr:unnamed protein product [Brachionus calyciflorus]
MDNCVKYNNLYGLIKYFIHDNDNFYGVCSILSFFHCPFYNRKFPELISSTKICGLTESIFVGPIEKMQKCVCIVANDVYYVSQMDT